MEISQMSIDELIFRRMETQEHADAFYKQMKEIDKEIQRRYNEGLLRQPNKEYNDYRLDAESMNIKPIPIGDWRDNR